MTSFDQIWSWNMTDTQLYLKGQFGSKLTTNHSTFFSEVGISPIQMSGKYIRVKVKFTLHELGYCYFFLTRYLIHNVEYYYTTKNKNKLTLYLCPFNSCIKYKYLYLIWNYINTNIQWNTYIQVYLIQITDKLFYDS